MSDPPDRIEKKVLLRAPVERVWGAIADAGNFGTWFGVQFDSPFAPGARLKGRITPTQVDPDVAKMQEPFAGHEFLFQIERVEPMRRFSFHWHPYAVEPADYSSEPMTLVVFELEPVAGGTLLTITESGFDRIPLARRAEAFNANDEGWTQQSRLIGIYLDRTA